MSDVSIIDYGINNLKSVRMAFEASGRTTSIVNSPEGVSDANRLVLPGIGTFKDGMRGLEDRNLVQALRSAVAQGTPLLGICLGMQLLFSESEEFGIHHGLDLIPGEIVGFPPPSQGEGRDYRVPHMGWTELEPPEGRAENWASTVLGNLQPEDSVYFVHSYFPQPDEPHVTIATATHGGRRFCSAVQQGNIVGTQFHPEKSGDRGIAILEAFCELDPIASREHYNGHGT